MDNELIREFVSRTYVLSFYPDKDPDCINIYFGDRCFGCDPVILREQLNRVVSYGRIVVLRLYTRRYDCIHVLYHLDEEVASLEQLKRSLSGPGISIQITNRAEDDLQVIQGEVEDLKGLVNWWRSFYSIYDTTDHTGSVYMIQKRKTVKIGMSHGKLGHRLLSYGKNAKIYFHVIVTRALDCESAIVKIFKDRFKLVRGREWFRGDVLEMQKTFHDTVARFM